MSMGRDFFSLFESEMEHVIFSGSKPIAYRDCAIYEYENVGHFLSKGHINAYKFLAENFGLDIGNGFWGVTLVPFEKADQIELDPLEFGYVAGERVTLLSHFKKVADGVHDEVEQLTDLRMDDEYE